jgi:DNA repair exonuclease SbcCD nuclease subunit
MRFIHTADWQIGKSFKMVGEKESVLRQARLNAIETIGRFAKDERAPYVLVAGDVYDNDAPSLKTLNEPIERMRLFPSVQWHLLPGNHDPHRDSGLWDRLRGSALPPNIHLHLEAGPIELEQGTMLLPAPLTRKSEAKDLTEWMDSAATPEGTIRLGLAHGSVAGFSEDGEASNPIEPNRAERAGLNYLALGDWHRTNEVNARTWYAGTHEADRFRSQECGQVLLVEIEGHRHSPKVTRMRTGAYNWISFQEEVSQGSDLQRIVSKMRSVTQPSQTMLRMRIVGSLPLSLRAELERQLESLEAAFLNLAVDLKELKINPSDADLQQIDFDGVLRQAADRLKQLAEDERQDEQRRTYAASALVRLYQMCVEKHAKDGRDV